MNEGDYWNVFSKYIKLEIQLGEKYLEWWNKNPNASPDEILKKKEFLDTIEYLRGVFTKQYHLMCLQSRSTGDFISEKQRLMTTASTNEYYLKRKITELERENAELKENIKL